MFLCVSGQRGVLSKLIFLWVSISSRGPHNFSNLVGYKIIHHFPFQSMVWFTCMSWVILFISIPSIQLNSIQLGICFVSLYWIIGKVYKCDWHIICFSFIFAGCIVGNISNWRISSYQYLINLDLIYTWCTWHTCTSPFHRYSCYRLQVGICRLLIVQQM